MMSTIIESVKKQEAENKEEKTHEKKPHEKKIRRKAVSNSSKAGLIFPVGRIENYIKNGKKIRISRNASIHLCSVVQSIILRIMHANKGLDEEEEEEEDENKRIKGRDVHLSIQRLPELKELFKNIDLFSFGIMPMNNISAIYRDSGRFLVATDKMDPKKKKIKKTVKKEKSNPNPDS
jgi:histone H2A